MPDKLELSVTPTAKKSLPTVYKWLIAIVGYSLWLAVAFGAAVLGVNLLVAGLKFIGIDLQSMNANLVNAGLGAAMYGMMLVITINIPRWVRGKATTMVELGLQRLMSWKDIAISLAGMIAYYVLLVVVLSFAMEFLPWINMEQAQDTGIVAPQPGLELATVFLLMVVVAPVIEEVIFRGYLYGKLRKNNVPFWLATLVVSVLFGLAHMQWNVGLDTFALGIVLCVVREVSGSLWPSILMHMMKNGIATYFVFINPQLLQGITG